MFSHNFRACNLERLQNTRTNNHNVKKRFRIYQSDSAFLGYLSNKYEYKIKRNEFTLPSKEQISSIRQQAYSEFIATEKHAATSSLLFQLIIIFVDIIVFWFHWRLARKNEQHG